MVQGTNNPTDVKDGMHYCMGANCINDKDKSNVFIWGSMPDTDPNKCAATMKESVEGSSYGEGKWTCKCLFGEKDKDMDNQRFSKANGDVRLSLQTLMAMPPLLLGIVGPIVRANLIRPY
uniref:SCP domain-containing protein n=1 Tax=Globodera pallida TaxID=36090 RepID=A0A183CKQ0_GLOPA